MQVSAQLSSSSAVTTSSSYNSGSGYMGMSMNMGSNMGYGQMNFQGGMGGTNTWTTSDPGIGSINQEDDVMADTNMQPQEAYVPMGVVLEKGNSNDDDLAEWNNNDDDDERGDVGNSVD
jgi:hypothetical protein